MTEFRNTPRLRASAMAVIAALGAMASATAQEGPAAAAMRSYYDRVDSGRLQSPAAGTPAAESIFSRHLLALAYRDVDEAAPGVEVERRGRLASKRVLGVRRDCAFDERDGLRRTFMKHPTIPGEAL